MAKDLYSSPNTSGDAILRCVSRTTMWNNENQEIKWAKQHDEQDIRRTRLLAAKLKRWLFECATGRTFGINFSIFFSSVFFSQKEVKKRRWGKGGRLSRESGTRRWIWDKEMKKTRRGQRKRRREKRKRRETEDIHILVRLSSNKTKTDGDYLKETVFQPGNIRRNVGKNNLCSVF